MRASRAVLSCNCVEGLYAWLWDFVLLRAFSPGPLGSHMSFNLPEDPVDMGDLASAQVVGPCWEHC